MSRRRVIPVAATTVPLCLPVWQRYAPSMRIALPTCAKLPDWEVDDAPLHQALEGRGVEIHRPVWDAPGFDWSACDACLIRTTWDYQEKHDAYVAWAKRVSEQTRLFNPFPVVQWNTHKTYLRDLERRGIPVTPTVWLEAGSDVDVKAILAERGWHKAFIKPAIGATARETLRFEATSGGIADAEAHLHRLLPSETMLLQPYLDTVETLGEVSAVFFDGKFSHGVRKIPVPGDYRVQDDFGAHDEPASFTKDELTVAERCLEAVTEAGITPLLYARTDFLRDHEGQLRLSELELVEPSLFFRHAPRAADTLVQALLSRIEGH